MLKWLRTFYSRTFGAPPDVGPFHPLWVDLAPLEREIMAWARAGENRILLIGSGRSLLFNRLGVDHIDVAKVLGSRVPAAGEGRASYDSCICELNLWELSNIERLYTNLRSLVKNGGHILVHVVKQGNIFEGAHLFLQEIDFPSVDISQMHFWGDVVTGLLARPYLRALRSFKSCPMGRALTIGAALLLLAPIIRLANARAARMDSATYRATWTSLTIEFTVKRSIPPQPETP